MERQLGSWIPKRSKVLRKNTIAKCSRPSKTLQFCTTAFNTTTDHSTAPGKTLSTADQLVTIQLKPSNHLRLIFKSNLPSLSLKLVNQSGTRPESDTIPVVAQMTDRASTDLNHNLMRVDHQLRRDLLLQLHSLPSLTSLRPLSSVKILLLAKFKWDNKCIPASKHSNNKLNSSKCKFNRTQDSLRCNSSNPHPIELIQLFKTSFRSFQSKKWRLKSWDRDWSASAQNSML